MDQLTAQIGRTLNEVRHNRPLIHHITNYVTANDCANAVLGIGASPIMADDFEEVEVVTAVSAALVLNIGTLNRRTVESMFAAAKKANAFNIPVILDPVGIYASELRNRTTARLLEEIKVSVLRGNISEIGFVAGLGAMARGVDASAADLLGGPEDGRTIAEGVAKKYGCVTAITGATDIVSDGGRTVFIENGTKLLSAVTGTGCMCTSLVGAFCGVASDPLIAAAGGVLSMGVAGELAAERAGNQANGRFHMAILDEISRLSAETLAGRAKMHEKNRL